MSETNEKPASTPAPAATETPAPESSTDTADDVIMVLAMSIWHKPLNFIASLVLTLVPLVGMFFVPADQSAVLRYALGGLAVLGLVWLLIYIFQVKACATYTITRKRCT